MSWLRNSPLRASFSKRRQSNSPPKDCDPVACYESFCKHWQQVDDIIERTKPPSSYTSQDDVVSVVNHMAQMATLLLLEIQSPSPPLSSCVDRIPPVSCLEYLLSENLLEKLYRWSLSAGRYGSTLRLEQLKLYELLAGCAGERSRSRSLLAHEAFLRPLLELLSACAGECFPGEVENRIVVLLNQLCVSLVHDTDLMHKFFSSAPDSDGSRFVVFAMLIPFVHREGGLGQQARDALLLCMALSATDESVAAYISTRSNVCPVLATGLSGLYSRLPRKLVVATDDWHRLTPDDVDALPELSAFLNSVEFCNAVVQVAHPSVGAQLLEFLQQGFLVPVLGPALLQSSPDELVAATAYLDLCLRSATEPGLLRALVHFLLQHKYDGTRLLDSLVARIVSPSPRLCLVTVALFETLADFDCEDVMLELVFRHLVPCHHVMVSQRVRIRDLAPYCQSAARFLSLSPAALRANPGINARNDGPPSLPAPQRPRHRPRLSVGGQERDGPRSLPPATPPSLYGDYGAYLRDARRRVLACRAACRTWAHAYDGEDPPRDRSTRVDGQADHELPLSVNVNGETEIDINTNSKNHSMCEEQEISNSCRDSDVVNSNQLSHLESSSDTQGAINTRVSSCRMDKAGECVVNQNSAKTEPQHSTKIELTPESQSGEKLKMDGTYEAIRKTISETKILPRALSVTTVLPDIGPFLDTLLRKLETLPSNGLFVNLHLTGLVSRLAVYPQPLLHSFLLNHSLVFQPSVRSLFQVLGSLKHRLDGSLSRAPSGRAEQLVADARDFLLAREERLANARRAVSATTVPSSDPPGNSFIRGESKRRSFTSTISSVFRRAGVSVPGHSLNSQISEAAEGRSANNNGQRSSPRSSWLETGEVRSAAMCAVLLDEWLKELAAITQEQALAGLAPDIIDSPLDATTW